MSYIRVRAGSVIGRDHLLYGKNRQDFFEVRKVDHKGNTATIGILSDGCGSGESSEVGASLITKFMANTICHELKEGKAPKKIIRELLQKTVVFLTEVLKSLNPENKEQRKTEAYKLLLATVLGFIVVKNKGIIFYAGDGIIFLDDTLIEIDQDNRPEYIAYQLFTDDISDQLCTMRFDLGKTDRFAISSDGFEPELIGDFWSREHLNGVQRLLNVYSKRKHFKDDATLIVVEKI